MANAVDIELIPAFTSVPAYPLSPELLTGHWVTSEDERAVVSCTWEDQTNKHRDYLIELQSDGDGAVHGVSCYRSPGDEFAVWKCLKALGIVDLETGAFTMTETAEINNQNSHYDESEESVVSVVLPVIPGKVIHGTIAADGLSIRGMSHRPGVEAVQPYALMRFKLFKQSATPHIDLSWAPPTLKHVSHEKMKLDDQFNPV
eukprot:CAMPEP_0119302284 /NCGR_PEP_ID=MMETSP1333-20130426/3909_1 /TAXON_ID=418940 /ORGANISM="Scyphosphaera apsteinii, Strain RCC1455" /LENGTH=201 /DNA_ID=CAMNT_0007304595 /DNA_START=27 /DNA_END=633 /DNA_ORIENTATION=+